MGSASLRLKFAVLFCGIAAIVLTGSLAWVSFVQQQQAEREMLETTQVLARQMDAVWDFMELNQEEFITDEDGEQTLYCVVAAKAVSRIFTENSDYVIHYTNTTTRKKHDSPDAFEAKALEVLKGDPSREYYYGIEEVAGMGEAFRYVEPLFITDSCLECHGAPKGDIDSKGYPKEGLAVGDIAGAVSISMPTSTYADNVSATVVQQLIVFLLLLIGGICVIFYAVSKLVTRPLGSLAAAARVVEGGNFDIDVNGIGQNDELEDLAHHFESMAIQLKESFEDVEAKVELRTEELAAVNELLREQQEKLEEDSRYKSDFLAIMSHELRTPLTSIIAFVEIWKNSYPDKTPDEKKIIEEIEANSKAILGMVNNILEQARTEAGKQELSLEPTDLADVLQAVRDSTMSLARKKRIAYSISMDAEVPVIEVDPEKIRRVVENLVSNAIKFTAEYGTVDVRIDYDQHSDEVRIAVADSGCGIAEEDLPHIFDSFVQGGSAAKYVGGGSGIGLAVVKDLTELHGGSVAVSSKEGEGSVFTISIPAVISEREELE